MKYHADYDILYMDWLVVGNYRRLIMSKTTAIYVRRSVSDADKGNNSLSIAAQREECIRFLGEGADFSIYCDDGK